jgi:hypothetical protein
MEGRRRREPMHLRPLSILLWEIRQVQVESFKTSRPAASGSRGSSPELAPRNAVQQGRRSCVPSFRLKGRKPARANMLLSDHRLPAALKVGVVAPPRAFGFHTFRAGVGSSGEQLRSKTGARTAPSFQHQDDPGHLCPSHYVGQAGGSRDVFDRAAEGLMGGEKTGNQLRCVSARPRFVGILWAS